MARSVVGYCRVWSLQLQPLLDAPLSLLATLLWLATLSPLPVQLQVRGYCMYADAAAGVAAIAAAAAWR